MSIHGSFSADGRNWIGYDYDAQIWIITDPSRIDDPRAPVGSALHPLVMELAELRELGVVE